jgi:hypothetical protein
MHYFLNVSQTIWKIEGPITNGQSRDTGNIGRHRKKNQTNKKQKQKQITTTTTYTNLTRRTTIQN